MQETHVPTAVRDLFPRSRIPRDIGGRIKVARVKSGHSQDGLAYLAGLRRETIWRIEAGGMEGTTAAGLARACFVSPQAMMILLKTTEQQGLIARTPNPRHQNVLELHITAAGREALHDARQKLEPLEARVAGEYGTDELNEFRELLGRFIGCFAPRGDGGD